MADRMNEKKNGLADPRILIADDQPEARNRNTGLFASGVQRDEDVCRPVQKASRYPVVLRGQHPTQLVSAPRCLFGKCWSSPTKLVQE